MVKARLLSFMLRVAPIMGFVSLPTFGGTLYVRIDGRDAGNGSLNDPWKTVQRAVDEARAGDIIDIGPGRYEEVVVTRVGGEAEAPIVLRGAAGNSSSIKGFIVGHSYITLENLEISGMDVQYGAAVTLSRGVRSVTIRHCRIRETINECGAIQSAAGKAEEAVSFVSIENNEFAQISFRGGSPRPVIQLWGRGHRIVGNTFLGNNDPTVGDNDAIRIFGSDHYIARNVFSGFVYKKGGPHTDIIQTFGDNGYGSKNILFEHNIIKNCESKLAQLTADSDKLLAGEVHENWTFRNNLIVNMRYQAMEVYLRNVTIANNLFFRVAYGDGSPAYVVGLNDAGLKGRADGATVANNMFIACGPPGREGAWYYQASTLEGVFADFNLVTKDQIDWLPASGFTELHGVNGGDPGFRNLEAGDFRSSASGVGVDAGTCGLAPVDFDGVERPRGGGCDIGPFETEKGKEGPPKPPRELRVKGGA